MSATCGACGIECVDNSSFKCSGVCGLVFHPKCVKSDGVGTRAAGKQWKCDQCKKDASISSKSSSGSTAITKEFFMSIIDQLKSQMFEEINKNSNKLDQFVTSVEFISNSLDSINVLVKKINTEMNEIKKENKLIREENASLKKDFEDIQRRIRVMEQHSRKTNLEISGLPVTPNENVLNLVKDVGSAIGQELQEGQVVAAHRVPSYHKERISSLVVRFQSQTTRDQWIAKYKNKRSLLASEVNNSFPKTRVYINEHLAPANKLLLSQIKVKCKDLNIKYAWYKEGKFFVRKSDGGKCFRVNKADDLNNLF